MLMSEVEKMYENVGVEPRCIGCYYNLPCCRNCNKNYKDTIDKTCKYQIVKEEYPKFTPEKQLKILCFIVNNKHRVTFHDQVFGGDKLTLEKIQENLAWAINRIWKDLTEEEKQQVKGTLE